jgi:hypothetical protein
LMRYSKEQRINALRENRDVRAGYAGDGNDYAMVMMGNMSPPGGA